MKTKTGKAGRPSTSSGMASRATICTYKGSHDYAGAVARLAERDRRSVSGVIDAALAHYAAHIGADPLPPRTGTPIIAIAHDSDTRERSSQEGS